MKVNIKKAKMKYGQVDISRFTGGIASIPK